MAASAAMVSAVRGVLDSFAAAYGTRDVQAVLFHLASGDSDVVIGTGADEWRVGPAGIRALIERDFAQSESIGLEYRDLHVDGTSDVAWLAAQATVHVTANGDAFDLALRLSGVLTRRNGAFKFVQLHLSAPSAGQQEGSSF